MLNVPIPKWSYDAILYRSKRFEICKTDPRFRIGEEIRLCERVDRIYTGRALRTILIFEQKSPDKRDGLKFGYSVIGFSDVAEDPTWRQIIDQIDDWVTDKIGDKGGIDVQS